MADLFESVRKDMLDEPLEENHRVDGDRPTVLRAERDLVLVHGQQARVRDTHPVGVAPQIGLMWRTT